jgi:hypothetical protein
MAGNGFSLLTLFQIPSKISAKSESPFFDSLEVPPSFRTASRRISIYQEKPERHTELRFVTFASFCARSSRFYALFAISSLSPIRSHPWLKAFRFVTFVCFCARGFRGLLHSAFRTPHSAFSSSTPIRG